MWAWRIFWRARVSRLAIDASLTSRALATSGVVSPHSVRSESATWVSGARLGWQQVKTRRSRSSATADGSGSSSGITTCIAAVSLSPRAASRLIRSTARRRATVRSQATGLSGTPSRGHVSSARTVASWTASSASAEVAGPPGEGREHVAARRPDELGELAAYVVLVGRGHSGVGRPKSMTGRTSTAPPHAAGIFAAQAIASSRSAHSSR